MSPRPPRRKQHTIQYASDLHLEFERSPADRLTIPIHPGTTALVLAGDVHDDLDGLDAFVRPLAGQLPVILVAGNHEFFTHELNDTYAALADWSASVANVHFLQNQAVDIDGLTFLGCTLWSDFGHADPALMRKAPAMMTDYSVIADREGPRGRLTPERILAEHRRSRLFLEDNLQKLDRARTVVVTHHAPSLRSTREKGEDWDRLYGSDLDPLIEDYGPAAWIHGHVHDSFEYTTCRTTIACNPRGYLGYRPNPDFDAARKLEIRLPIS
jgi:Icc-related predicted phosphoesterase